MRRRLRDKRLDDRKVNEKPWTPRRALEQVERERWQCLTCSHPALENSPYCMSCKHYWDDVEQGRICGIPRSHRYAT